jgi:hypothetical protein
VARAGAIAFMVGAKLANVGVPLLLKQLVDAMTLQARRRPRCWSCPWACCWPMARCACPPRCSPSCASWCLPRPRRARRAALRCRPSSTCTPLSLRFHLERQTGGMTRDIERGVRGIESLISFSLFNIGATLIEVAMVLTMLAVKFDAWFAWITLARWCSTSPSPCW